MRRRTFQRWVAPVAAAGLFGVVLIVGDDWPDWILVNESPSVPPGLYFRTRATAERGALVAIAQPAAARSYLKHLGMPHDVLLLKRVAAVEGDRVCAWFGIVRTPGRRLLTIDRDRQGAALPVWRDCRRLARDELFLLGDTPGSFDSRYFGPVLRGEAVGVYREVLTW